MEEDKEELIISFETLYDLFKREKDRADLQKIDSSFFGNLVEYVHGKKSNLNKLSSYEEKKRYEREMDNLRRLLSDFYAKREKKIIGLALDKSRSKSTIVDMDAFFDEEKSFFNDLITLFSSYREGVLFNLIEGKKPELDNIKNLNNQITKEKESQSQENDIKNNQIKNNNGTKLIRFIHAVPKFVGEELEEYGPFSEEDVANLPNVIADLLISKGRAEEINSN